jgi:hypothetical protein
MLRWFLVAVILWLVVLTILTLIAIFHHTQSSSDLGRPALIAVS